MARQSLDGVDERLRHVVLKAQADAADELAVVVVEQVALDRRDPVLEHAEQEVVTDVGLRSRRPLAVVLGLDANHLA